LYNGNISNTIVALSKIDNGAAKGYSYGYDQLNRLVFMNQHTVSGSTWSNSNIITAYAESIAYDANGNILKYLRKGSATTLDMDSLNYKYNRDGNNNLINNKLNHVRDQVSSSNYTVDIDNQSSNNYVYDLIGNLKKDVAEGIDTIRWTVYGKINRIVKNGSDIEYRYDAGGNRTSKKVITSGDTTKTFYVRDAQGNVLAVYEKINTAAITWEEQHLYGSSRLGMWRWDTIIPTAPPIVQGGTPIYDSIIFGSRQYELSNHLQNILTTISDKKIGHNNGSNVVDYYVADVVSAQDYYPFGKIQPGRQYGVLGRYTFNGKEYDKETKNQDYGMRIYNQDLGRFLSVDPITSEYPELTPYQFASNSPIEGIDWDGLEYRSVKDKNGVVTDFVWDKENAYDDKGNLKDGYYLKAIKIEDKGTWSVGTWSSSEQRYKSKNIGSAELTVYSIDKDGNSQIEAFKGSTMPSDPNQFATIEPGFYFADRHKHRNKYWALQLQTESGSTSIPTVGSNPARSDGKGVASGINIHKAGANNATNSIWSKEKKSFEYKGKTYSNRFSKQYSGVSEGCITVDVDCWADFYTNFPRGTGKVPVLLIRSAYEKPVLQNPVSPDKVDFETWKKSKINQIDEAEAKAKAALEAKSKKSSGQ